MALYLVMYVHSKRGRTIEKPYFDWLEFRLRLFSMGICQERTQLLLNLQGGCSKGVRKKRTNEAIIARDIQDTHNLTCKWMPDRCRCASEVCPSITIVFCRHELHDMTIGEGRADCIGAGGSFTPIAARNEVNTSKSTTDSRITKHIQ